MTFDTYDLQKNCLYAIDYDRTERTDSPHIVAFLTREERDAWISLSYLDRASIERKSAPREYQAAFENARNKCLSR